MAKKARKTLDLTLPIYQLKISLRHISPLVWRRVQVDDCSLDELHGIIQTAMGWDDAHLHAFVIAGEQYASFDNADPYEYRDSCKLRLSDLAERGHVRFQYDYDFGDDWHHQIDIEKTLAPEEGVRYPRCVAGARACPPEDCGGPYGYPDFLEQIQAPENEEHEEMLEWIGGGFDPEAFDLDKVNEGLRGLRPWLGRRRGKLTPKAAFAKGSLVKVKPEVVHEEYPDIPLGGWVGRIKRIAFVTPIAYGVRWTGPTLDQAHPVYAKRCQRDEKKPYKCWLYEDQLEAADDETPTAMETPTNLVTRPLSEDEPEDRVRMIFGLTSDDPLPKADEQTQQRFLDHLKAHLSFPFEAEHWLPDATGQGKGGKVTVLGFADPPFDRKGGILCVARQGNRKIQVPLGGLLVDEEAPNSRHIEDYAHWRLEVQEFDKEDDEEG